jgi:gliding motility-associated-like protein
MFKKFQFFILVTTLLFPIKKVFCQQDVEFHLNTKLLPGKKILKAKRDFYDPYVWVLAQNNGVFRVNSLDFTVDDYTAAFSGYSNLQFVDIAGRSRDTVFIATNSTNVIHYKNGAIRLIGTADGIPGTVNSVGIAESAVYTTQKSTANVMIATDKGFRLYNSDTETITADIDTGNSKVYEATYRTEMYKDSSAATSDFVTQDTIQYQPSAFRPGDGSTYAEYLWEGGKSFGYNINTALVIYDAIYGYNPVFSSIFWGNSRGMFQVYSNDSYYSAVTPSGHYLNGINVNKITSIYGLTSFGSGNQFDLPRGVKQNLLIGTDQGFYFTSSIYTGAGDPLRKFSLFHDDELGNIVINDVCVNAVSTTAPICENGVWLAANDGLYFVKPDYGKFLGSGQLSAIYFQNKPDTLSNLNICAGDSVNAVINTFGFNGGSYQWYKNGVELAGESKDTLTIKTAGDYYAVLYDPCSGIHMESNHLRTSIVNGPVFSFNYPAQLQQCSGAHDTLKTDDNPAYHYRWYTNGVLNGDTTSLFIASQTGKYKVEVSACTNNWVPSTEVEITIVQLPVPVITTDKSLYCTGDIATLTISIPADPSYTISWYLDNALLSANTNQTILMTNNPGSYYVLITNNTINSNGTICSQTSAVLPIFYSPQPTVTIEQIVKTTLCEGQTIDLLAHYTGGTVKWSTGETTDRITVSTAGNYLVTVTSPAGCIADTSITIVFFANPVLSISDTSICTYKRQAITLTAPPGFAQYEWNGVVGGQTHDVNLPQTVSLTVTDANGCQATQDIKVAEKCGNIYIPNTFTPNNDGINDTWAIEGLENDQTVVVRVYNRYGTQIFESKGYSIPWDGKYADKKIAAGVYYYIVTAKNGTQKFSGSLTIIY